MIAAALVLAASLGAADETGDPPGDGGEATQIAQARRDAPPRSRRPRDDDDKRPARRREREERRPAEDAGPVTIPVDVGVGLVALVGNPPLVTDQLAHAGVALSLAAVVDQELIRKNKSRIPPGLRRAAMSMNEVRIRPWFLALVPEVLVISPQLLNTGMYGAIWRPAGIGLTFVDEPVRLSANAALDLAYVFVHSATLGGGTAQQQSFTQFLRPGVNVDLVLEVPITDSFLVSTGWSSDLFIPQPLGGAPWEIEPLDQSLWHLGGPFLKAHVRIPYTL